MTQLALLFDDDRRPAEVEPTWRCIDCTWSTRAVGRVAHDQVDTHRIVFRHALAPRRLRLAS